MKELDVVTLKRDLPGVPVPVTALGTIVFDFSVEPPVFEVEFVDDASRTIRVYTIKQGDLDLKIPYEGSK